MSIGVEVIPSPEGDPEQVYRELVGPVRALRIGGVLNARDVGGLAGEHGTVRTGLLVRSACLENLNAEGVATLTGLGLRTVIDLRTPLELEYHPNLVAELVDVNQLHVALLKTLAELDELPEGSARELYRYLVDTCGPGIVAVLEHLARPDALPALVHCLVGKDRTGLTVALLLELLGVPRDAIVADYVASNAGLGTIAHTAVQAEVLEWTLAGLDERHGGPRGYLAAHGLRDETVETLRELFLY
ncbi:MAG TPA: tyrosine-protein phosphatase [Actinospica sp.]|jgi:protein-tyrosine phosphatase|nr:tyrosine-protein phosphatase [Actinospica sp.]